MIHIFIIEYFSHKGFLTKSFGIFDIKTIIVTFKWKFRTETCYISVVLKFIY